MRLLPTNALTLLLVAGLPACTVPSGNKTRTAASATTPQQRQDIYARKRHAAIKAEIRKSGKSREVVFLGDSITDFWRWQGAQVWQEMENRGYRPINLGVAADRTEHVLWRISHGELDGLRPKVVVILIGTNNIGARDQAAWVTEGIARVAQRLHQRLPDAKIILCTILPRGNPESAVRQGVIATNRLLHRCSFPSKVRLLDAGAGLVDAEGKIKPGVMWRDRLHLTAKGYRRWFDRLDPVLSGCLPHHPAAKN